MTTFYQPLYGVEPYNARGVPPEAPFGGGADITQENLLVTLFEITGEPDDPQTYTYNRVKPAYAHADGAEALSVFGPGASKQLHSRNAFRSVIAVVDGDAQINKVFLALLNPPAELKQMALDPNHLASAGGPAGIQFNSSQPVFTAPFSWDLRFLATDFFGAWLSLPDTTISGVILGTSLPIPIPPFKTSGADGSDPVPYGPFNSISDIIDVTNEIKNGAPWFIPLVFAYTPPTIEGQFVLQATWPHSGASRG
jgi:hypothetical protein